MDNENKTWLEDFHGINTTFCDVFWKRNEDVATSRVRWNECLLAVFGRSDGFHQRCTSIFTCQTDKMRRYYPHPGKGDHLGLPNPQNRLFFRAVHLVALFIKWGFNEDLHHQIFVWFPYLNRCLVFMKGQLHFFQTL